MDAPEILFYESNQSFVFGFSSLASNNNNKRNIVLQIFSCKRRLMTD
jgi:hypothetical protein